MEATFSTLTDKQRVETLNCVYQKGVTTPKEKLAFSADKLVYLKPFLSKLQEADVTDLSSRIMVRQVVDQLLQDIADEVTATSSKADATVKKLAVDYGLTAFIAINQEDTYLNQVA